MIVQAVSVIDQRVGARAREQQRGERPPEKPDG
jgi:hypothetical protein